MYKKLFFCLLLCVLLTACVSAPVLPTAITTVTPAPYVPVARGTPLPPLYQSIQSGTVSSLTLLARWSGAAHSAGHLAFMPEGDKLVIDLQLWNARDGMPAGEVQAPSPEVNNSNPLVASSPDGRFIATTSEEWKLDIETTTLPKRGFELDLDHVVGTTFLPDSQNIVIFMSTGEIWFVPADAWMSQLKPADEDGGLFGSRGLLPDLVVNVGSRPQEVIFSRDGSVMAVVDGEGIVQIWDVATLERRLSVKDAGRSTRLALSPDGRIVAFGAADQLVHLWDAQTGQMLSKVDCQAGNVKSLAFSPNGLLLASLNDQDQVCIWGILPPSDPGLAAGTATAFAQLSTLPTGTRVSLPAPTPTPSSSLPPYTTLPWPVAAPTEEQVTEVRQCDVRSLASFRYPEGLSYWAMETRYTPKSACDWAALAVAYQSRQLNEDSVSEEGKRAFFQAVKLNPAFVLQTDIFYMYFGSMGVVSAPDVSRQPIKNVSIDYAWSGMGEPSHLEYTVTIDRADLPEEMKVSVTTQPRDASAAVNKNIDPALVQAIGPAMVDLVPIRSFFTLRPCTDNLPDWKADITFSDGTGLKLITNSSNMFTLGGPWQVQIEGQKYVQFSPDLLSAFSDLFDALGLPLGLPMGTVCDRVDPFELAYP